MELHMLRQDHVLRAGQADVGAFRERQRIRRLRNLTLVLGAVAVWLWFRILTHNPVGLPQMTPRWVVFFPTLALIALLGGALLIPLLGAGRSPHVMFRPQDIDISLDDVKGMPVVVEEVVKTLNLFLAHKTFRDRMGGTPRRAMLFEGPPGTGKTYIAKAMAKEAGVPFLFVASSAFQSMYYGQTNRKIRSYFKALRSAARREGGAIGFIEEIDAIGASRSSTGPAGVREGVAGVVNELLIQLQSFDVPPASLRVRGWVIDRVNRLLPVDRQRRGPKVAPANILVIGATNRAADLDPALLRPGRFDRTLAFDLPSRAGRREIIDFYLDRKAHDEFMDKAVTRDTLAAMTFGYSPVMIEHVFDEALVWALRRGADRLSWPDVQQAKMTEEIGLAQPVEYTEAERRTIATHEAGHATVAWLVGKSRKLEVLSIIKRKDALGLLAHSDREERYTKTRSEMDELIKIAMGGMVAEELFLGETSSGVAGDLQAATTAAAQMVGSLGMAGALFSHEAVQTHGLNLTGKVSASEEGQARIEAILGAARDEVRTMLREHRHVIEGLRDALLERDELIGDEILDVIRSVAAESREPLRIVHVDEERPLAEAGNQFPPG
ncbi:MAG: AAA family ATPase [Actinobacteria bacterium]|nr:MAG: AAA family ATPase [Actinomycetota bacterium]